MICILLLPGLCTFSIFNFSMYLNVFFWKIKGRSWKLKQLHGCCCLMKVKVETEMKWFQIWNLKSEPQKDHFQKINVAKINIGGQVHKKLADRTKCTTLLLDESWNRLEMRCQPQKGHSHYFFNFSYAGNFSMRRADESWNRDEMRFLPQSKMPSTERLFPKTYFELRLYILWTKVKHFSEGIFLKGFGAKSFLMWYKYKKHRHRRNVTSHHSFSLLWLS